MSLIATGNWGKALWPGINAWWGQYYNEHPQEWSQIFPTYKSRKAFEEDVGTSGFGLAHVKAEGAPVMFDHESQSFVSRYNHIEYALGFVITKRLVEDDLYDVVGERRTKALAFSARQTKETVAANLFNRAFDNNYLFGDGQPLLSATRPNKANGTFSNRLSVNADLSEMALEQAWIDISKFTNDRGRKISVQPQKLIIPADLYFEAHRILGNPDRPGTADRDINALVKTSKYPGGIVMNHYLTDPDAWFIVTNAPDGLKHFERRADEFTMDNDFDTDNAKFKFTGRYSFGMTDPRGVFGSPGA